MEHNVCGKTGMKLSQLSKFWGFFFRRRIS